MKNLIWRWMSLHTAWALVVVLWSSDALAVNYTFCSKVMTSFTDGAIGSTWTEPDAYRPLRGAKVRVRHYPSCSVSGSYAEPVPKQPADVSGCVSFSSSQSSCFLVTVWSEGTVPLGSKSMALRVLNESGHVTHGSVWVNGLDGGGTKAIRFGNSNERQVYAVTAYAYRRFNTGMPSISHDVYMTKEASVCGCAGTHDMRTCYSGGTSITCAWPGYAATKFGLAHEFGHAIMDHKIGAVAWPVDLSADGAGWENHTVEYQAGAIVEGWAQFVAGDVFNDDTTWVANHAGIRYSRCGRLAGVNNYVWDLAGTNDLQPCPWAILRTNYTSEYWAGRGTPADWARAFWRLHTTYGHGHGKLLGEMASFFDVYDKNDQRSGYDQMRQGFKNWRGSCSDLDDLDDAAWAAGTLHCKNLGDCTEVAGCD